MTTLVTPDRDFDRDRWKRPLIIPAGGGKPVPYRRCTSYVDVLSDKFTLQQWEKRQVAAGLAQRDDLRLAVLAHLNDKAALDRACADAKEYALAGAKATKGTAFHALTDLADLGDDLPAGLPDNVLRTLDAFREATRDLKVVHIESKVVLDTHQVAGTPDRVYSYKGERFIGDTKTGNTQYGVQKIATAPPPTAASSWTSTSTPAPSTSSGSTSRPAGTPSWPPSRSGPNAPSTSATSWSPPSDPPTGPPCTWRSRARPRPSVAPSPTLSGSSA